MNAIYQAYKDAILTGFGFLHVEAADIYLLLGGIAFFSILLGFLLSPREININQPMAWGALAIVLAIFIDWFPELSQRWAAGMWEIGSTATGGRGVSDFEDFDGLLISGYELAKPIISGLHGWSWWEIASRLEDWFFGFIAVGILILVNAYLAFRLFILMLSYITMSLVAMITLPAMVWNHTSFLAEGALRFVAGTGISILGFGIVLSVVWGVSDTIEFLPDMTKTDTLSGLATATVGFFLALRTQSMIQGYFSGAAGSSSGIGGAIRSGLYAMGNMGTLMRAASSVSNRLHSGGSSNSGQNRNVPPTSPNVNPSAGVSGSNNGFGGQWRQPNSGSQGHRRA